MEPARSFAPPLSGVLHVAAVWDPGGREPRVLRIGPESPRSQRDAALLEAGRSWADAIVTTGRILREEPELVHRPAEPAGALPRLLVLTRQELPAEHPALHAGLPVERFEGTPREALDHLETARGARRILVEAGPSTARTLYEPPLRIDVLWLSRFLEPELPEAVRGAPFPDGETLASHFPEHSPAVVCEEESGRWSFQRYAR